MTEPKHIASSLRTIIDQPIVKCILNRSCNISEAIDEVSGWWSYDLHNRKPSPAYNEYGVFLGTDLDLACFLYALADRGAVINIPYYKAHSQTKIREDQQLKSKSDRHGQLIGVSANKDFFSFNITIIDQNVVGEDKVGDFRTFSLTDKDGSWYDGWKTIQFDPTLRENRFITENKLWSGNKIFFRNFIHPNRWTSFFGQYYVISKILVDRLEEESKFLHSEMKRIMNEGISFPDSKTDAPQSHDYKYGETVSKQFVAFNSMIYIPGSQVSGTYDGYPTTQEGLVSVYKKRKYLLHSVSKLRFMTRASEYAHYINPTRLPSWLKNVSWEQDFTVPGKRVKWERLKLFQPKVGEHSVSILKRTMVKTVRVAA